MPRLVSKLLKYEMRCKWKEMRCLKRISGVFVDEGMSIFRIQYFLQVIKETVYRRMDQSVKKTKIYLENFTYLNYRIWLKKKFKSKTKVPVAL